MSASLYWYDLETFGTHPARDRIAQFAGLRTSLDLREVGAPLEFFCQPAADYLPDPEACLVTGITPQDAARKGVTEREFCVAILEQIGQAATCVVGYNNIRFDDEFLRHLFFRNFHEPYTREYARGSSRWDLLDVLRLAHALRPDGIEWPRREDGTPSFRLELLTAANGIAHRGAHDALADVRATVEMARLLRRCQPRLFDYAFEQRGKHEAMARLRPRSGEAVFHVSGRIPARFGAASLFLPLAMHPVNRNAVICFDLRCDPQPLLELDAGEVRRRVFTPQAELGEGERIPLKEVHSNRCPVVLPAQWVDEAAAQRLQLDLAACEQHRQRLLAGGDLRDKLHAVFQRGPFAAVDAEYALYDGFLPDADRRLAEQVRGSDPQALLAQTWPFEDARMPELLLRYLGRNFPAHLHGDALADWRLL